MNRARREKRRPDFSGRLSQTSCARFSSRAAIWRRAFAAAALLSATREGRLRRRTALAIHRRRLRSTRAFTFTTTLHGRDKTTLTSAHAVRRRIHGTVEVRRAAGTASTFARSKLRPAWAALIVLKTRLRSARAMESSLLARTTEALRTTRASAMHFLNTLCAKRAPWREMLRCWASETRLEASA